MPKKHTDTETHTETQSPNPETLEQGCPLRPSPDPTGGTWPQAPRRTAGQHQRRNQKNTDPLAEKGNLEQLLNDAIDDQERQKQQERGKQGSGCHGHRFLRAAKAAERGQLQTAARQLGGSRLLPPTEATADVIEQLYQMSDAAQKRTNAAFEPLAQFPKSDLVTLA